MLVCTPNFQYSNFSQSGLLGERLVHAHALMVWYW